MISQPKKHEKGCVHFLKKCVSAVATFTSKDGNGMNFYLHLFVNIQCKPFSVGGGCGIINSENKFAAWQFPAAGLQKGII
jgi:hypothetical protein